MPNAFVKVGVGYKILEKRLADHRIRQLSPEGDNVELVVEATSPNQCSQFSAVSLLGDIVHYIYSGKTGIWELRDTKQIRMLNFGNRRYRESLVKEKKQMVARQKHKPITVGYFDDCVACPLLLHCAAGEQLAQSRCVECGAYPNTTLVLKGFELEESPDLGLIVKSYDRGGK